MIKYPVKSRKGVYYQLDKSPYEYKTSYGEILKFRSQKRLDMYTKEIIKRINNTYNYLIYINRISNAGFIMDEGLILQIEKVLYTEIER